MSRRKNGLLFAALALTLAVSTACSGAETSSGTAAPLQAENGMAGAPQQRSDADAGGAGAAAEKQKQSGATPAAPAEKQPSAPVEDRKLVQTARMDITAPSTFDAIGKARTIATDAKGFTGQEEASGDKGTVVLRIPADRFDGVLTRLAELGQVTSQHKQSDDVTEQVVDVDARLATQRASVERVRALLARATTIGEITQVEGELTKREAELEVLQGRKNTLAGKVALSTVTVRVTKDRAPVEQRQAEESKGGFLDGFGSGWTAFGDFFTGLATIVGALLPFLVALAIPVAAVIWVRRKRRTTATKTEPAPAA